MLKPRTAPDLSNLALALTLAGNYEAAEPLFRRAIAIGLSKLGLEHPRHQRFCSHYAYLLLVTGRTSDALLTAEGALAIHEKKLGPNHPWTKYSASVTAQAFSAHARNDEKRLTRSNHPLNR